MTTRGARRQTDKTERGFFVSTAVALEDYVEVTISEDKLYGYIQFAKFEPTFQCTAEQLETLLHSNNVRFGIQTRVLQEIASNPQAFARGATMIAHGKAPVDGEDGSVRLLVRTGKQEHKPVEQEDGTVDLKEVKQLDNVKRTNDRPAHSSNGWHPRHLRNG